MKSVPIALLALLAVACASAKPSTTTAPKAAAPQSQTNSSAEAQATGAKLAGETGADADMFGAPNADGLVLVHFDYDSAQLSDSTQSSLRANAEFLSKHPGAVAIEGHCDERGSDEYNLALGESRAKAVRDYLARLGIQSKRLEVVSYGSEQPLNMAHDEQAWAQNRRAQFRQVQ